ncbi:MAG: hypothetical protein KBD56_09150 [Candidatus Eisenbacteria bacterium]|nr:hypothetical protein [Candidatus Eisenbacteria bacterium]
MDPADYVMAYRKIIPPNLNRWVLFRQGTVFVFPENAPDASIADLQSEAIAFLREHGPVCAGTASGDFDSFPLKGGLGWLVRYSQDGLFNFVPAAECPAQPQAFAIGLIGRAHRAEDAAELQVTHVEKHEYHRAT